MYEVMKVMVVEAVVRRVGEEGFAKKYEENVLERLYGGQMGERMERGTKREYAEIDRQGESRVS